MPANQFTGSRQLIVVPAIQSIQTKLAIRATIIAVFGFTCFITPTRAQIGDFNSNGVYDCADIGDLTSAIVNSSPIGNFDLTGDGVLNQDDVANWLGHAGNANLGPNQSYVYGDLNLDGDVDGADTDLIQVFKYQSNDRYCQGDLNADGRVDALDNATVHANLFTSFTSVEGAGSDGTPAAGQANAYYDPGTGDLWLDTGGDRFNGWSIVGPEATQHHELTQVFEFGILMQASEYFAGAEQIINRSSPIAGVLQLNTYPTGLTAGDFGQVVGTSMAHPMAPLFPAPWATISPQEMNVTVATIQTWNGGSGAWFSGNWQGGAATQSNEVALLDIGSGEVRIEVGETANSIETLVRSGVLQIDGTHVGDVTIFDTSAAAAADGRGSFTAATAAVSGAGQIDGDLVLMGRLGLSQKSTLTVSGKAILSEGYQTILGAAITGNATLVSLADFVPANGDSTGEFAILSAAGGIEGVFTDLALGVQVGNLFVERLTYTETEVFISLGRSLPGDANRDGVVDVSDLNIWSMHKFTSGTDWSTGDFNYDGVTDISDLNIWHRFKFSIATAAVPEPTGMALMMMGLMAFCSLRRTTRN